MIWLWYLLISIFTASVANILQRVLMKDEKSDPLSYAIIFQFTFGTFNLLIGLIHGLVLPQLSFHLAFFLLSGILWGFTSLFFFKGLKLIESSESTILLSSRTFITIGAAILFLKETLDLQKIIGVILMLISVFLITELKNGFKLNKGAYFTLIAAFCGGLAIVSDAYNVKYYDPISYSVIMAYLPGIILLLFSPKSIKNFTIVKNITFLRRMIIIGFFFSIQAITYFLSLAKGGTASQVGTINRAEVIITVILAVIFLKERDHLWKKLISAVLVTVGVVLLS